MTNNTLLQWVLEAGVPYQTSGIGLEAPDRQQIVVDRFTRQAEQIVRGPGYGLAPLTPAQMRDFVVTPELYHDDSYEPPSGVTTNVALPTPIRQLQEVIESANASHPERPLTAAQTELWFFTDFWTTLFSSQWDNHQVVGNSTSLTLSLRDLWVKDSVQGYQNQVFWYDDPTNPTSPGIRWIYLPQDFPLIDFYWPETEVSRGAYAGTLAIPGNGPLSSAELGTLGSLVTQLVNWGPPYDNVPSSPAACLLEMMRMGFNAATVRDPVTGQIITDNGRHWLRLKNGTVQFDSGPPQQLTPGGGLPLGGALVRQDVGWAALAGLAFPLYQTGSLFRHVLGDDAQVPYTALYTNPMTRQVKTTLSPEDTNAIVKFFLALGGNYVEPGINGDNPSRKLARFQLAGSDADKFMASLPATYPLTDGLQRVAVARALLDTEAYLLGISPSGIPPFSQCFRARAHDHTGQVWPASPTLDNDCVGGALRSVWWFPDTDLSIGWEPGRGFQPKFLSGGGSIATMLALFPNDASRVDSYFWCTPGVQVMTSVLGRFDAHMDAFANNILLDSHYDDFLNHSVQSASHGY